ncbi:MAG: hypothetical protein QOE92_1200 [Chloroflexota bacterium]|jgi:hypothetical protein|nr:hypothetical protein [Chloroflexota bacterium]
MSLLSIRRRVDAVAYRKRGQVLLIFAFLCPVLIGAIAIAMDLTVGYYYSVLCEKSAAAGALAGVLSMPQNFAQAKATATELVMANGGCNGATFVAPPAKDGTSIDVQPVAGFPTRLSVKTSRQVPAFFARLFGSTSIIVSRTAVAEYLPPIGLGQPGQQVGSAVSELGTPGSYALNLNGWNYQRFQGDAFTPDPAGTSDVHRLSAVTGIDTVDPALPDRGGWNYLVNLPQGGQVQVFNAAGSSGVDSTCDNRAPGSANRCNTSGLGLGDSYSFGLRYTLFSITDPNTRGNDVELSQYKVYPLTANPNAAGFAYNAGPRGGIYNEAYNGAGEPTVMPLYRWWANIGNLASLGPKVQQLVDPVLGPASPDLPPGFYRLRIDIADVNGSGFKTTSGNHRWAVRVRGPGGQASCKNPSPDLNCTVNAWEDIDFAPLLRGSTTVPLFQLGREYAGLPVNVYLWDLGDAGSSLNDVVVDILDPTGVPYAGAGGVPLFDLRDQLSNAATLVQNTPTATVSAGGGRFNGKWVQFQILVRPDYTATAPNDVWSLRYRSTVQGGDVLSVVVRAAGSAVRLVSS